ncbi:hypothetical protein CDD82_664 [Ophiocordyceps australis]|uniref:RING-type domain-containing protein n=1 Tax=Ophiocordyceps australis TaxID=1399860 RepID=A0A2C5XDD0_9HYPO|nr:hypothetical protein CDD82_664 [Ophiocordyceps australis]
MESHQAQLGPQPSAELCAVAPASPSLSDHSPHDQPQPLDTHDRPSHFQDQDPSPWLASSPDSHSGHADTVDLLLDKTRAIVRLFQCHGCSLPYNTPYTLPCGRTICKKCLPRTHPRNSITYPATPLRLEAFECPFDGCDRQHVLDDCSLDVIVNKTAVMFADAIKLARTEAIALSNLTHITVQDVWQLAGISSLRQSAIPPKTVPGGRLLATWTLVEEGDLDYGAELSYRPVPVPAATQDPDGYDAQTLASVKNAMRSEMDCQICYGLFIDPLTTGCGHTFCRSCLHRVLDHSRSCPVCRRPLSINSLLKRSSCPSNYFISHLVETFWSSELQSRKELLAAEMAAQQRELNVPLFICTLAFPYMPTFLHIFEPRYRLMIRRALEGDRTFGMVLPKSQRRSGDAHFCELGTLLRIVNAQFYPDGRSLIETVGLSRFRVVRYSLLDGYTVAKTERVDDVSVEEEEALEATEVGYDAGIDSAGHDNLVVMPDDHQDQHDQDDADSKTHHSDEPSAATPSLPHTPSATSHGRQPSREGRPLTVENLNMMSTESLICFAKDFVRRMGQQSARWMTDRMLAIYGECPDDPIVFPWWFASTLPVKEYEKYRLLATSSVRERFKICALWILEIQRSHWSRSLQDCVIL